VQQPLHTEPQLLEALSKGDHAATQFIYDHNYKIVTSWLAKQGCQEEDAADIFQEAMVVLYSKSQDADFRLSSKIGTYLFAISKHQWYKKLENQYKQPLSLKEDTEGDEEGIMGPVYEDDLNQHMEREHHFKKLNEAMDQLGEPCRSLLKAYYNENRTMLAIAESFGYTNAENAKTQKYKCLARLKKLFHTALPKIN
jgi:RNA polymerase sigma factor (sigma-70 family)